MREHRVIDEPVRVAIRTLSSGKIVPKSFVWQGQTHYVAAQGRQWAEQMDGKRVRCFLVQTMGLNSYELRWEPVEDVWNLHRAWLMNAV
jgi:hypothetical protein